MDNSQVNKTVARVVDLLELLARSPEALTLNDICTKLSLPKSSGFELVQSLVVKGFVRVDDARLKTYRIGLGAYSAGAAYLANLGLPRTARPFLEDLNRRCGGTAFLGIEDKGSIVYLDKAESEASMRPTAKLGSRRNMHTTGLGKALLAAFPDNRIAFMLGDGELPIKTRYSASSAEAVMADCRATRERGYSIDDREDNLEMYCIGCAVWDHTGLPAASISVASLYSGMTEEKKESIVRLVTEAALKLSRQLGFRGERLYGDAE